MLSVEPWTIPGCGYPDLLATGEICDGDTIHDRQHPHDLFMEIAAEYDQPIGVKSAHDLHVHESSGTFTVAKLQLGYTRDLPPRGGVQAGVGGSVSASIVPAALGPRYGGRVAPSLGVFFTVQPAAHAM